MNVIEKIAMELKLDQTYLSRIADRSAYYYKTYAVPKRNGQQRIISQPSAELKTLQYWVLHNILNKLPVSEAAYAYKKGDSVKRHARFHERSRFFLHADICDFFPSIRPSMLENILITHKSIFADLGLDFEDAMDDIQKICFRRQGLSIGAVSSPAISNIVMCSFDRIMLEYCQRHEYRYSRYADDIYISSKDYIDAEVLEHLQKRLLEIGFVLNLNKTRFYSPKMQRKVTGLVITDDAHVSVGTERRKYIKKIVYDKLVHGKGDAEQVLGYLAFLKDIEPNTYNNIIIKYSSYCQGDIIQELGK